MSNKLNKSKPFIYIAIAFLIFGILAKIMHWPFGRELPALGFLAIFMAYAYRFYLKEEKNVSDYAKLFFVLFFCAHAAFSLMHWPGKLALKIAVGLSGLLLAVTTPDIFGVVRNENRNGFSALLMGTASLFVIAGALFKIMHWPYSIELILTGLGIAVLWFLKDLFSNKNE